MNSSPSTEPENAALSGELGTRFRSTVLLALWYGAVAGTAAGFIIYHVGWLMLRLALCAGLGLVLGLLISRAGRSMHCRSQNAMLVLTILAGLLSIHFAVTMYIWIHFGGIVSGGALSLFDVLFKPLAVWLALYEMSVSGMFIMGGRPMSALQVWLYWGVALGGVAVCAFLTVRRDYGKLSYCEPCIEWLPSNRQCFFFEAPLDPTEMEALERGELSVLRTVRMLLEPEYPYIRLELAVCPRCHGKGVYQLFLLRNDARTMEWQLTDTRTLKATDQRLLMELLDAQQELRAEEGSPGLRTHKPNPPVVS